MRPSAWIIVLVVGALTPAAPAADKNELPKDIRAALDKATELEVYSLDPVTPEKAKAGFHGWKVLGKTTVKDADVRKKLLAALYKGVAENQDMGARCFQPRLGLRAMLDAKTVDLVVCFECLQIEVFVDDKKQGTPVLVSGSPEAAFDKVLQDAKVPLADKPKK